MQFPKKQNLGFTLLEVIVVVFLLALFASVGSLQIGLGEKSHLESEVKVLKRKIDLLLDESLILGKQHRVDFNQEDVSYSFGAFEGADWVKLLKQPFVETRMRQGLYFQLKILHNNDSFNSVNAININSDSSLNEFELVIGFKQDTADAVDKSQSFWVLKSTLQGGLTIVNSQ